MKKLINYQETPVIKKKHLLLLEDFFWAEKSTIFTKKKVSLCKSMVYQGTDLVHCENFY